MDTEANGLQPAVSLSQGEKIIYLNLSLAMNAKTAHVYDC